MKTALLEHRIISWKERECFEVERERDRRLFICPISSFETPKNKIWTEILECDISPTGVERDPV